MRSARATSVRCACALTLALPAIAQDSRFALRFHALGNGQDRAALPVDDDALGPDASEPGDIGAASFTLELWLRGLASENASASIAPGSYADQRWRSGRVVLDRSSVGGSQRTYAMSLANGRVCFYTGAGEGPQADAENTTIGAMSVLDGAWHHVALVRDVGSGRKRIVIDGQQDVESPTNTSRADLSYPDAGTTGPHPWNRFLVIGASKDDTSASFAGRIDELRLWNTARATFEIAGLMRRRVLPDTAGLAGEFRFEEGSGTGLADSSYQHGTAGTLYAGQPGSGAWTNFELDPLEVAPISGSLPLGFQREMLTGALDRPTAMEFTPDGRLLITQLYGKIRLFVNGSLVQAPVCTLPVLAQGECGLLGIAVDPSFAQNGYVYVFRTTPAGRNRVSRLTLTGTTIALASELVVWETPLQVGLSHHGGALEFGADGRLYIATGDQYVPSLAQDLGSVHGKLLRIASDGSVPTDNPFVSTPGARPEIWALGLRNPFRFRLDAVTSRMWLGDVGGNGPQAWEELDLVERGANYGWPFAEGPACYQSDCSTLRSSRFHYRHDDPHFAWAIGQGCIVAGPAWRGSALPPEYSGNLIVGDFAEGWLWRLVLDAAGNVIEEHPFELGNNTGAVVDLTEGPDGGLYVLTHVRGTLARIRHGTGSNLQPLAIASADVQYGVAPLRVQFLGSSSFDPDQGPSALSYQWLFGDGASSTETDPSHTYTSPGSYRVSLLVGDGIDITRSDELSITLGHPPLAAIASPPANTLYRAGETIAFAGSASDTEDGVLGPDRLTWRVLLVHELHEHPFSGPRTGAGGTFTIPSSGHGPEHTHYRIVLEALDADGLLDTSSIDLLPRISMLELRAPVLPGFPLFLDGEPIATPRTYESVEGFAHHIEAPPNLFFAGRNYVFDSWSSGVALPAIDWTAPVGGGVVKAFYHLDEVAEIVSGIYAVNRNAEWREGQLQAPANPFDPTSICVGRDAGEIQAAFAFPLPLERGVEVRSARLEITAAADQLGAPSLLVRAYALRDAPPFEFDSPIALSNFAPLLTSAIVWTAPPFAPGESIESPELTALVQELVVRPDWIVHDRIGLVLTPLRPFAGGWRCVSNFDSGFAPRLHLRWRTFAPEPALPPQHQ